MTKDTVTLKTLDIHRFLGCREGSAGIHISKGTFSDGINIIYGPNGSGKTTLARSVLQLLWPSASQQGDTWIEGSWSSDNDLWYINVNGAHITHTRNGEKTEATEFPPREWQNRYYLALHELLTASDTELLAQIRHEIHGGVDLEKAKMYLGFDYKAPSAKSREISYAKQAESRVREITEAHRHLQEEEVQLDHLRNKETQLKEQHHKNRHLDKVVVYRKVLNEASLFETKLQNFSPYLANLTGNERDQWEEIAKRYQDFEQKLRSAALGKKDALEKMQQTGMQSIPDESDIQRLNEHLKSLIKLETKIETLNDDFIENSKVEEISRMGIHHSISEEKLLDLDLYGMEHFKEWQRLLSEHLVQKELTELLSQLLVKCKSQAESDPNNTAQWMERFIRWLEKPDYISSKGLVYGLGITYLISLCGIGFIALQEQNLILSGSLFCLFASGSWLINTLWKYQRQFGSKRSIEKQFNKKVYPHTFLWKREEVKNELHHLIKQSQKQAFQTELNSFLDTHRESHKQKLTQLQQKLDAYQSDIFSKYPIELDQQNPALTLFFEKLSAWQQAYRQSSGIAAKLKEARSQYQETLDYCNTILSPYFENEAANSADLSGFHHTLHNRMKKWRESHSLKELSEGQTQLYEQELSSLDKKREELLKKVSPNISPETYSETKERLFSLLQQKSEYNQIKAELQQLNLQRTKLEQEINPENINFDQSLDDLEQELESHEEIDGELQKVRKSITEINTKIELAKNKHDLTDALACRSEAYQNLQHFYDKTCTSAIGNKMIRFVIERSTKNASEVLKRARELFGMITKHRYQLLISDEDFKARDTITGCVLRLDELSSGTRIQLLLSVRVAFIDIQEGPRPKLPLLLDEVLGNSDDERTGAIIEAIVTLAKEGRQIFYFTAQSDEVKRWVSYLQKCEGIPYQAPIILPVGESTSEEDWSSYEEVKEVIPPPGNSSYQEYGKILGVPLFETSTVEQMHLWHILDNQEFLYQLLLLGYERWGQLDTFVNVHGEENLVKLGLTNDPYFWSKAKAMAESLAKAKELVGHGKGKAVDELILANSGCISTSYLKKIIDLNTEVAGDAKQLVERLEEKAVPRFRKDKIEALKEYLTEHNYLDPRQAFSADEVKQRLDAFVADQDYIKNGLLTLQDLIKIKTKLITPK